MSLSSPIIRVSRKRQADPQTALVVEVKRQKNDQLLFSLFKTSDAPEISVEDVSNPVIDFRNEPSVAVDESNPLSFANNSINEVGGPEPQLSNPNEDVITVNGRPLVPAANRDEDVVYDFYKIVRGDIENMEEGFDDWNMRFATKEEALLVHLDNDSSDDAADDDDDSNDENNWRNDYPDEDGDSEGDPDDTESERENWHDEEYSSGGEDDGLRLRMQRFGLGVDDNSDSDLD